MGKFSQSSKRDGKIEHWKIEENNAYIEIFTRSQMKKFNQVYQRFQVKSSHTFKQISSKKEKWFSF